VNGTAWGSDLYVLALAEDGELLASHVSSCEGWAKSDIGATGDRKHENYRAKYPDGFEVVWLDNPSGPEHAELIADLKTKNAAWAAARAAAVDAAS
jgi:hypothetical protein